MFDSNSTPPTPKKGAEVDLEVADLLRKSGKRSLVAIGEWISHCIVVAAILVGMWLLHGLSNLLWRGQAISFLGLFSLDELFATADFILLCLILLLGIGCVSKAYRGVA